MKLDTLAGYWFSLYTLQMSLLKMSSGYRLILTAWEILEIDRQTLVGVGGISSSFLGQWQMVYIYGVLDA